MDGKIDANKNGISYHVGMAINIGAIGQEKKEGIVDAILVFPTEKADGNYYDEFSDRRIFIADSLDDMMSDEFLGLKDGEVTTSPYELFVLRESLFEITKFDMGSYLQFLAESRTNTVAKLEAISRIAQETILKKASLANAKREDMAATEDAYRRFQEAFKKHGGR